MSIRFVSRGGVKRRVARRTVRRVREMEVSASPAPERPRTRGGGAARPRSRARRAGAVEPGTRWESPSGLETWGEKKASKTEGRAFWDHNGETQKERYKLNDSVAKPGGCRHAFTMLFHGGYMWHTEAGCCPSVALMFRQVVLQLPACQFT